MHTAKVVNKDTWQWVRLPPEITIEPGEIAVLRMGDSLLLTPAPPARTPPDNPWPSTPPTSPSSPPPAAAVRARAAPAQREEDLDEALDLIRRRLRAEAAPLESRAENERRSVRAVV